MMLVCAFFIVLPCKANAASKTKELKENTNYQIDLDGDKKKETFKYTVTKGKNDKLLVNFYVNNKKKYSISKKYCYAARCYLTDFKKKDNYKDIFVEITSDSACFEVMKIVEYKKKTLKEICTVNSQYTEDSSKSSFLSGRRELAPTQKGDGTVTITADTPFYKDGFGCYYVDMKYKIKNKTLKKCKQSTYPVSKCWKKSPYTLTKKVTFTTTRTGTKKAFVAKKGKKVYFKKMYYNTSNGTMYVKMATKSGKTGWVKITGKSFFKEVLKYKYAWG